MQAVTITKQYYMQHTVEEEHGRRQLGQHAF